VLIESQKLVCPDYVKAQLHFSTFSMLTPFVPLYKISRLIKLDRLLKSVLLPSDYKNQINEMDETPQ
jgi:hypothetical protein